MPALILHASGGDTGAEKMGKFTCFKKSFDEIDLEAAKTSGERSDSPI